MERNSMVSQKTKVPSISSWFCTACILLFKRQYFISPALTSSQLLDLETIHKPGKQMKSDCMGIDQSVLN